MRAHSRHAMVRRTIHRTRGVADAGPVTTRPAATPPSRQLPRRIRDRRHLRPRPRYKRTADPIKTISNSQSPLAIGAFELGVAVTGVFVYQASPTPGSPDSSPARSRRSAPTPGTRRHPLAHPAAHGFALDSVAPRRGQQWMSIQPPAMHSRTPRDCPRRARLQAKPSPDDLPVSPVHNALSHPRRSTAA